MQNFLNSSGGWSFASLGWAFWEILESRKTKGFRGKNSDKNLKVLFK